MSFTTIQALLDAQLATVTGLPTLQLENTRINPTNNTPWARATFIPAPTIVECVGPVGKDKLQGIYQVDLFYPQDRGTTTAGTMADLIVATFSKGLRLGTSSELIIEIAYREVAYLFDPYYAVPITVKWFSFA